MSNETNNVDNILVLLEELDTKTCFNVYIPSIQKEASFKQLTTEQLKKILKTIIDSPIYNTEFILTINSIIKENCISKDIDIDNLTVLDKQIILFKTRIESISPTYIFNINNEEFNILLTDKLTNLLTKKLNFNSETYSNDTYSITCSLPTFNIENKLEKELHQNITALTINTPDDLRNVIGEVFINEITKFITTITINNTSIDLNTYTFKDRIKIIEKLPISLINNAIKYIEKYRNIINDLYTFNLTTKDNIVIQKEIPQDASFFNP